MYLLTHEPPKHEPWNKGKITGQKPPLKLQEIWAIRFRLQLDKRIRDLALFNLAIDSKLRACDLVSLGGERGIPWAADRCSHHGHAAENTQTCPVRNHAAGEGISPVLD